MTLLDHYRALHETSGYFRRHDRGRLVLRGADCLTYLHGLLTNDIASLPPNSGCYAALLTPQGRMISDMRVFDVFRQSVLIDLERPVASVVRDHLEKFVITEDVTVEDVSDTTAQIGVYGPAASATLTIAVARVIGATPPGDPASDWLEQEPPFHVTRFNFGVTDGDLLRSDDIGIAGFDAVLPVAHAAAFEEALAHAGAVAVDPAAVDTTRIEAGIPKFLVDMDTTTIPLEAGIEDRAISMTKGCYVGQEVIIRVLHRGGGRVAKRLVRLHAAEPIRRDDPISSGGREIGQVTSAAASPARGGFVALGYVGRDFAAPGTEVTIGRAGEERRATVNPAGYPSSSADFAP